MKVINIKTNWVVDVSFIVPLFLADEDSSDTEGFLNVAFQRNMNIFIPALWWFEMSNTLHIVVKRQRLSQFHALNAIEVCKAFNFFKIEPVVFNQTLFDLAQAHNLSAYDASYLDLAIRHQAALATFDQHLNVVAKDLGIETWVK